MIMSASQERGNSIADWLVNLSDISNAQGEVPEACWSAYIVPVYIKRQREQQ